MAQATAELETPESATHEQSETGNGFKDMLASYANDDSTSTPTTSPDKDEEASAQPDSTETATDIEQEVAETAETHEAVATLETALAELKELRETSKQSGDSLGGRLGSVEHTIKLIQAALGKTKAQARASIEEFGEFGKDYEEFAKAQVEFVNKQLEKLEVAGLSPEFVSNLIKDAGTTAETAADKRYARLRSDACREDLDETHPTWRTIVGLPDKDVDEGGVIPDTEYRRWLATQPEDYQKRVSESYSPVVMGRSIDKFNEWKKSQAPKPKTNSNPSPSARLARLGSAVTAKSTSTVEKPKKDKNGFDAMLESYNTQD